MVLKGKETILPDDDNLLRLGADNQFFKDTFSFNTNFIFHDFKTSYKSHLHVFIYINPLQLPLTKSS